MKKTIAIVIFNALLVIFALVTIVPFVWMLVSSFATNADIVSISDSLFPKPTTLDNYTVFNRHSTSWAYLETLCLFVL